MKTENNPNLKNIIPDSKKPKNPNHRKPNRRLNPIKNKNQEILKKPKIQTIEKTNQKINPLKDPKNPLSKEKQRIQTLNRKTTKETAKLFFNGNIPNDFNKI
ncbi:MAG: hypothetical protein JST58_14170 [Bacteroidetes bacterium]|nr:hypothetical protein [Bacteroidota bacterium]